PRRAWRAGRSARRAPSWSRRRSAGLRPGPAPRCPAPLSRRRAASSGRRRGALAPLRVGAGLPPAPWRWPRRGHRAPWRPARELGDQNDDHEGGRGDGHPECRIGQKRFGHGYRPLLSAATALATVAASGVSPSRCPTTLAATSLASPFRLAKAAFLV